MVIAGRHAPPVLEPTEHDLNAVVAFVSALIVFDRCFLLLSVGDAGMYPFVFTHFSELN